jgi:nitrate/TMAO reductase-like tetraheme cytochrome c subunit
VSEEAGLKEEDYIPKLTRGMSPVVNDSDNDYIKHVADENTALVRRLNMNENDFLRYQENQVCSNCHLKGHTVDQCQDARKGIRYEHCKRRSP